MRGLNGFHITMMFSIPLQFYADEHITLMVGVYRGREERIDVERQREAERRSLPSPLFKFTRPSQMAVFSCMRLEDVSDSRCRFLGKLIFQAKLFLFRWRLCVCVYGCFFGGGGLNKAPPLCFEKEGQISLTDCRYSVGGRALPAS